MPLRSKLRGYLASAHGIFRPVDFSRLMWEIAGYRISPEACAKLLDSDPKSFKLATFDAIFETFNCSFLEIFEHTHATDSRNILAQFKCRKRGTGGSPIDPGNGQAVSPPVGTSPIEASPGTRKSRSLPDRVSEAWRISQGQSTGIT
jgi:hypothetical protein